MKRLDFLKKLPTPVRMFAHPMLFISLVLHALLLMMPISSNLEKFESAEKEETVKITKLPSAAKSSSGSSPQPSPKPTSELTSQPNLSTSNQPQQQIANPINYQVQPKSNLNSQAETSPSAPQESESSQSSSSKSPNSESDSKGTSGSETDSQNTNVNDPLEDFLSNFPFPENAQVGSLGVLSKEADSSARNVNQPLGQLIKYYGKELPTRKYTLAYPTIDHVDLQIYQVSKNNVSQYLHLIKIGENTVIFLSDNQLDRKDIANLEADTEEEREFKNIIRQVIEVASTKELTSDITSKLAGGKYNDFGIFPGKRPAQIGSDLNRALSNSEFRVDNPIDLRQNGLIYPVSKNSFKGFIQLIPTQDGSGTAIISLDDFSF
ncbi:MAG TPA: hypothetical protein DD379_14140 [Cyanobacteria bacterium UBA11162]|nr:hypothetical protein [Cyanobacteria bacterium UBA11162]